MIYFEQKNMNIVITGGSKGIGKAIAQKFVSNQYNVFICARNIKQLEDTANELISINPKVNVFYKSVDLTEKEETESAAHEILQKMNSIDVLVNNTGTFQPGEISTEPDGILDKMLKTNLYSAYHFSRALIPSMKQNNKGHIINICSIASLQAYKNGGAYSISKYALLGFSKNLREELKPFNIKVTSIMPGATMTDSWKGSGVDETKIMHPQDIAEIIWTATHLSNAALIEDIVLRPLSGDL